MLCKKLLWTLIVLTVLMTVSCGQSSTMKIEEVITVTVNHSRTIADGIASGKYDSSDVDINDANFPSVGSCTEPVEIIIVNFDKILYTGEVISELKKQNLRPATLQELLTVTNQSLDKRKKFQVAALGSIWWNYIGGYQKVAYIESNDNLLMLKLITTDCPWSYNCRFAAVRAQGT